ncbi:MAG TPA: hypothetical protein VGG39_30610 [Polyangiaceae bacterium]
MHRPWSALVVFLVAACHPGASGSAGSSPSPSSTPAANDSVTAPSVHASPIASAVVAPQPPAPTSETYPPFRKTTLSVEDLTKLVTAAPELARVGTELAFFDPADGSYIARSTADHQGVSFTSQPVLWSPEPGQQVLVVAARGKSASFVAAWWVLPDGGHRLASTFVMLGEIAPVALAYRATERTLWWTTCWQCPGETGHVSVREDHHVVIVQD